MDTHPIFVHFPIAFLSFYAIFEVFQIRKFKNNINWFFIKVVFLVIGTGGAYVALLTGDQAKELQGFHSPLVDLHESFAQGTTIIFTLLLAHYLTDVIRYYFSEKIPKKFYKIWTRIEFFEKKIFTTSFIKLFAFVGGVGILVVGALGGAIVYGPDVDPIVFWVYHIFF